MRLLQGHRAVLQGLRERGRAEDGGEDRVLQGKGAMSMHKDLYVHVHKM